jgi:ubiquinone/menaquinone biosynthesis C-methylase UbiE
MLKEDYNVLEIGCGPGYFSLKVAEKIYNGKLFLADLQQEMLDYAKKRMNRKKILNVEYYLCNGRTLEFDKHTFDRVFMVAVFGEIEHKNIYLHQIHSILKDEGILSISELAGNPDKITLFEIKKIVCEKGFELIHVFGNEKNFTLNFKKRI